MLQFQKLHEESVVPLDSGIHYFYTVLKAPDENIKLLGKGLRVFIQGTNKSVEEKPLIDGSLVLYKVIYYYYYMHMMTCIIL
jgi:hypothetical protein